MKTKLLLFLLLLGFSIEAQETIYVGPQSDNIDKTVYTAMQNIWYANEKISYLCPLPIINNQISPAISLRDGEGKTGSYVFEGNLYYQVPIAMGRNQGSHFFQTSRMTFDFGFNIRMAEENSSPLVPNNNIIGLTLEKKIYNSYTKKNPAKRSSNGFSYENWYEMELGLHDVSINLTAHHFSNGQQDSLFVYRNNNGVPIRRNNYKSGDFSTNYLNIGTTYSYLSKSRNLYSANIAYQWDGTFFGPLSFTEEQKNNYGQHRVKSFLQFRTLGKAVPTSTTHDAWNVCNNTKVPVTLNYYSEYVIRWESDYIIGSMSDYIISDKKYRFNQHLYLQYTKSNWRALGFIIHAYYGRDYSNVRYDMPILAIMTGMSINFNKYKAPLKNAKRYF
jgi:hypothetical protein